jgi:hypothetical protein
MVMNLIFAKYLTAPIFHYERRHEKYDARNSSLFERKFSKILKNLFTRISIKY